MGGALLQKSLGTYIPPGSYPGATLGPLDSTRQKLHKLVQLQAFVDNTLLTTYTFLINPERYQQTEAVRAQVLQTLGGGYADLFGPALVQIQFSGTTGLQPQAVNGFIADGYQRFQDLTNLIRQMWSLPIQDQAHEYHFYLYNWTDDQYYEVLPLSNVWSQAVPRQLVFYYELTLIALREAKAPTNIVPYAVKTWFTSQPANSVITVAQDCLLHAALAYEMMQAGSTVGVPAAATALLLQAGGSYIPYLQPNDYPIEELYPGITKVITLLQGMVGPNLFPFLTGIVSGGQIPLPATYGTLQGLSDQASNYLNQLEALNSAPSIFIAEWGDVADDLQQMTLFPEAFSVS